MWSIGFLATAYFATGVKFSRGVKRDKISAWIGRQVFFLATFSITFSCAFLAHDRRTQRSFDNSQTTINGLKIQFTYLIRTL